MADRMPPKNAAPVIVPGTGPRTDLVTILFVDMVQSTALKQRLGDRAGAVFFASHHRIVRETLLPFAGAHEIETAGDSFLITFATPSQAVQFALLLQARILQLGIEKASPCRIEWAFMWARWSSKKGQRRRNRGIFMASRSIPAPG